MQIRHVYCRTRRKRLREMRGIRDHYDGMSTDDELNNSDTAKFNFSRGTFIVKFKCDISLMVMVILQMKSLGFAWVSRL